MELGNSSLSEAVRSALLVELVQYTVQQDSRYYHIFVNILQENQSLFGDILQKLKNTYTYEKKGIKVS